MSGTLKKSRSRARKVIKDSSRQTSLLDVFSLKSASKKSTPSTSVVPSENVSAIDIDEVDIPSSDAEPFAGCPVDSSSPLAEQENENLTSGIASREGTRPEIPNHAGGSREAPIFIPDSSPVTSPSTQVLRLPTLGPPPNVLYSVFAPRKRKGEGSSAQLVHAKSSCRTLSTYPYPDSVSQHVRGPQTLFRVPLSHFTRRDGRRPLFNLDDRGASIYSRLNRNDVPQIPLAASYLSPPNPQIHYNPTTREQCMDSIPSNHRLYPAIRRMLSTPSPVLSATTDPSSNAQQLWVDRWRPRRADEVLGNEQSALYLRDWLLALKLHNTGSDNVQAPNSASSNRKGKQKGRKSKKNKNATKDSRGIKRPRIVRDVERKRRRLNSEDDWIADDDSDDNFEGHDPLDIIDDWEADCIPDKPSRLTRAYADDIEELEVTMPTQGPTDSIPPFSYIPHKLGDTLYNTIILAGPTGCGKTAAVYACAEELGWDVFEVYPGIGDRSGTALLKLIGDVGKNHLVRQTQQPPKAEKELRNKAKLNFFAKRVMSDDENVEDGPTVDVGAEADEPNATTRKLETASVSQSIVLVEEVDVLYRDDTNFWPTMVKIIRECRRPIVMTCNDISFVPQQDLPLQAVLHFAPCPTSLAASYLQLLSLADGRCINTNTARHMYEGWASAPVALERKTDELLHPQILPSFCPDFRRTLNHLQIDAGAHSRNDHDPQFLAGDTDSSLEKLKLIAKSMELCSFVDSGLCRTKPEVLRDLLLNSPSPSADDVVGFKHLVADFDDSTSGSPVTFSTYDRHEAITNELLAFSLHHYHSTPEDILRDQLDVSSLHTSHCVSLLPVVNRLRLREHLIRDPNSLFLDYEPWVRHMVVMEDARIVASLASSQTEGTTRQTRNSQRSHWEAQRMILLDDEQRKTLRHTGLIDMDIGTELETTVTFADPVASQSSGHSL